MNSGLHLRMVPASLLSKLDPFSHKTAASQPRPPPLPPASPPVQFSAPGKSWKPTDFGIGSIKPLESKTGKSGLEKRSEFQDLVILPIFPVPNIMK